MRFAALLVLGCLACPASAGAQPAPSFTTDCKDGTTQDHAVACDVDAKADGMCTFADPDGSRFRVPASEATRHTNSNDVTGDFRCAPAVEPAAPVAAPASKDGYRALSPRKWHEKERAEQWQKYCKEHGLTCLSGKGTDGFIRDLRRFAEESERTIERDRQRMGPPRGQE